MRTLTRWEHCFSISAESGWVIPFCICFNKVKIVRFYTLSIFFHVYSRDRLSFMGRTMNTYLDISSYMESSFWALPRSSWGTAGLVPPPCSKSLHARKAEFLNFTLTLYLPQWPLCFSNIDKQYALFKTRSQISSLHGSELPYQANVVLVYVKQ